jgi:hypothetical protein
MGIFKGFRASNIMKKLLLNSGFKEYRGLLNPNENPELNSLKFDVEMPVGLFEYNNIIVNDLGRVYDSRGAVWDHEETSTILRYCLEMRTFRRVREDYRNLLPNSPKHNLCNNPFLLAYDIRIIGNYFHFIVDFVGRLMAVDNYQNYIVLLPEKILNTKYDYIQQVISMLNIECYFIKKNSSIKLKKLYAVSPVISSQGNQRKDVIVSLRKFFIGEKGLVAQKSNKSIYISRNNAVRGIKDEDSFIGILKEFNVDTIYPEDFNFKEMIQLMGNYNHLIGVDGAQLTNMLFMQDGSKICSLKHLNGNNILPSIWFGKYPNMIGNYYFFSMANNLDYKFYNLYCEGSNNAVEWPNQDLIVPITIKDHLDVFFRS